MSPTDNSPAGQLARLKAQRKSLDDRIAEADNKHLRALGLLIRQASLEDHDTAFLKGVLAKAASLPKGSNEYRELVALGSKK